MDGWAAQRKKKKKHPTLLRARTRLTVAGEAERPPPLSTLRRRALRRDGVTEPSFDFLGVFFLLAAAAFRPLRRRAGGESDGG